MDKAQRRKPIAVTLHQTTRKPIILKPTCLVQHEQGEMTVRCVVWLTCGGWEARPQFGGEGVAVQLGGAGGGVGVRPLASAAQTLWYNTTQLPLYWRRNQEHFEALPHASSEK